MKSMPHFFCLVFFFSVLLLLVDWLLLGAAGLLSLCFFSSMWALSLCFFVSLSEHLIVILFCTLQFFY